MPGILYQHHAEMLMTGDDPKALLDRLAAARLPDASKWMARGRP
jgi:hypothetical protein